MTALRHACRLFVAQALAASALGLTAVAVASPAPTREATAELSPCVTAADHCRAALTGWGKDTAAVVKHRGVVVVCREDRPLSLETASAEMLRPRITGRMHGKDRAQQALAWVRDVALAFEELQAEAGEPFRLVGSPPFHPPRTTVLQGDGLLNGGVEVVLWSRVPDPGPAYILVHHRYVFANDGRLLINEELERRTVHRYFDGEWY